MLFLVIHLSLKEQAEIKFSKTSNLDSSKALQESDVPTKPVKENAELFTDFLH